MNELFERLGCSETQAKVYLLLLELGPSIASMLAKRSRIKRVTVYGALEGLLQKGLVETFKKNNINYFQAVDPQVIQQLFDDKLEKEKHFNQQVHKSVQELKHIQDESKTQIIDVKGVMKYYQGDEAVKTLITETLDYPEKLQYCIGLSGYHVLQVEGHWRSYIKKRVKKGMKVKSIQAETNEGKAYQKKDAKSLRETRLIPEKKCPDEGELNIIGDKIILYTSEGDEPWGVKIMNKKIARILKKLFELAWDHAKELNE